MTKQDEPREFWINLLNQEDLSIGCLINPKRKWDDDIHVIEYSAYEQLQQKLDIAVKALKDECYCDIDRNLCYPCDAIKKIKGE